MENICVTISIYLGLASLYWRQYSPNSQNFIYLKLTARCVPDVRATVLLLLSTFEPGCNDIGLYTILSVVSVCSVVHINSTLLTLMLRCLEQHPFVMTQNIQSRSWHCNRVWLCFLKEDLLLSSGCYIYSVASRIKRWILSFTLVKLIIYENFHTNTQQCR